VRARPGHEAVYPRHGLQYLRSDRRRFGHDQKRRQFRPRRLRNQLCAGQENPDANLLAFSGDTLYGIRHSQYLHRWKDWNDRREGYLFAASFGQMVDPAVEKVPFWAVNHRLFWIAAEKEGNPRFKSLAVGTDHIVVASQPGGGLLGGEHADAGEVLVYDKAGRPASRTFIGGEPRFDGVALADGKIFVSMQKGGIVCLK